MRFEIFQACEKLRSYCVNMNSISLNVRLSKFAVRVVLVVAKDSTDLEQDFFLPPRD